MEDRDIARILKTSTPTIKRWKEGKSSPHPLALPAIFNALDGIEDIEVEKLRKRLNESGMVLRGIDIVEDSNPSKEKLAKAINDCLDAIERGDFEVLDDLPD